MTAGPVEPGAGGGGGEDDFPRPPERPLPRDKWDRRDREDVVPEDMVQDVEVFDADGQPVPFPPPRANQLTRQVGEPGLTSYTMDAAFDHDPEIAQALKGLAESAAARPESRFLRAEAPESVRPGQRFAISVRLPCVAADGGISAALRPFLVPKGGRSIAIDLGVTGGLKVLSDTTVTIIVLPGEDSDWARFELSAQEPGPAKVVLRAWR